MHHLGKPHPGAALQEVVVTAGRVAREAEVEEAVLGTKAAGPRKLRPTLPKPTLVVVRDAEVVVEV